MKDHKITASLLIAIIVMTLLLNIQFYFFAKGFAKETAPMADDMVSGAFDVDPLYSAPQSRELRALPQQLEKRTKIDDFLEPELWDGADNKAQTKGSFSFSGKDDYAYIQRKFDGFLNLRSYLFLDINAEDIKHLDWITLYLLEDQTHANYFECPLLSLISEDEQNVIINKKDFIVGSGIPDWSKISMVKLAFGTVYGRQATVTISEISTYDAYPLCSIWFDDGWRSTYTQAYPMMKEKGMRGILSVVSGQVDSDGFCSEEQLREMYEYGWDLVNHTHNHIDLTEAKLSEAEQEIAACRQYLDAKGFSRASDHFVSPYGATNKDVDEIIRRFAVTSRPNWDTFNGLPVSAPYQLGFMEVTNDTAADTVREWIDTAIENGLWLVLLFHSIDSPADTVTKCDPRVFKDIVDYLDEKKTEIRTVTLSELLDVDVIRPNANGPERENSWQLAWEDNFDGTSLDPDIWNIVSIHPSVNNELQSYREENISITDGFLAITSDYADKTYYSGAVNTANKKLIQHGKLEIRAKLPSGQGVFPAIWLKPASGAILPEIDIIEFLGHEPGSIWHVFHYEHKGKKTTSSHRQKAQSFTDDFHTFSLEWTEKSIKWLIDGTETFSVEENIPSGKMYLYINTAIGGDWPGAPDRTTKFPQTLLIDSVKYYTRGA